MLPPLPQSLNTITTPCFTMNVLLFLVLSCCAFSTTTAFVASPMHLSSPPIFNNVQRVSSSLYYQTSTQSLSREDLKRKLPPVERREMTALEVEFRDLLEGILYTTNDIESISDPRLRAIYEGISASYYEPAVYRAFEVLYSDLAPLRIAGRMIYKTLRQIMQDSLHDQQEQMQNVITTTGLPVDHVRQSWKAFNRLAEGRELSIQKLHASMGDVYAEVLSLESLEDLIAAVDPDRKSELTFEETVVGLHRCTARGAFVGPSLLLLNLTEFRPLSKFSTQHSILVADLEEKKTKHNARYDDMLEKFAAWKELIPSGQGRRLDILHGCFVGSENPKVVDALRVVYVDYPTLRVCGNWIFNVVSTLINASHKRRGRQPQGL
jgi:hypothetical protein